MIETPRAMLNIGAIAALDRDRSARFACLVAGTNDLVRETGTRPGPGRRYLVPWLMQIVVAACAGGKTLIHPAQIGPANAAFSPSEAETAEGLAIRAAFAQPGNEAKGVISIGGSMVERLHLDQAKRLLARAGHGAGHERIFQMKLYRFLSGPDDSSFCHKVTAALNQGWYIHGSPTYAYDTATKTMRCGQAVFKEIRGKDYHPDMKLGEQ